MHFHNCRTYPLFGELMPSFESYWRSCNKGYSRDKPYVGHFVYFDVDGTAKHARSVIEESKVSYVEDKPEPAKKALGRMKEAITEIFQRNQRQEAET